MSHIKKNGNVAIIFLAISSVLIGILGLTIDGWGIVYSKKQLQSALDLALIAGSQDLPNGITSAESSIRYYATKNGINNSSLVISTSYNGDSNQVYAKVTKDVKLYFMCIFGTKQVTVSSESAVKLSFGHDRVFDYSLFSGSSSSQLILNGSNNYIGGDVHTNSDFIANGSMLQITGVCESVGTQIINASSYSVGSKITKASKIPMPDFSDTIKAQAKSVGNYYSGEQIYGTSTSSINKSIYVDGNVIVNGSKFTGKGAILATGNITFNGSCLTASTNDAVCFYSKNGNIIINGSSANIRGILYAPRGQIIFNGSSQEVDGRVIGDSVIINGSKLVIASSNNDFNSLPSTNVTVSLTK